MSEVKHVKIEYNGGHAYTAKVTDANTGEAIPGVYRVEFSLDAGKDEAPSVNLYSYLPVVAGTTVTTDASMHTICPHCGQKVNDQQQKGSEVIIHE